MGSITSAISDATTLFGAVVVLAITIVGFFKGREWFNKMDSSGGNSADERYFDDMGAHGDYFGRYGTSGHDEKDFGSGI